MIQAVLSLSENHRKALSYILCCWACGSMEQSVKINRVNKYLVECWRYAPQQTLIAFFPKIQWFIYSGDLLMDCHVFGLQHHTLLIATDLQSFLLFQGFVIVVHWVLFISLGMNLESTLFYKINLFFPKGLHWKYSSNCEKLRIVLGHLTNEQEICLHLFGFKIILSSVLHFSVSNSFKYFVRFILK